MSGMHMPEPGPEHDVLRRMTGIWNGAEHMHPSPWSPEPQERVGRIEARMLEGFFVVSDYLQTAGDEVTFRGHGVYSWDAAAEKYVMYWFDSMGGAGCLADGTYADDVLTFVNQSPAGHHRYRYTFGDGEMRFDMAMSQDGESWNDLMNAVFTPA